MRDPAIAHEIGATIAATASCAAWLWRRDEELALQMRDEFMAEWGFESDRWNDACAVLIDYAIRKGEGAAPQASFEAVLIR